MRETPETAISRKRKTASAKRTARRRATTAIARPHIAALAALGAEPFTLRIGADGRAAFAPLTGRRVAAKARARDPARWLDCIHPEDREAVRAAITRSAEHLTPFDHTYRILGAKGETSWFRLVGHPRRIAGREVEWTGAALDVSGRERAVADLGEMEARFSSLIADVRCNVFRRVLYPDGRLVFPFSSGYGRTLFGSTDARLANDGWHLLDIVHPEDRERYREAILRSARLLEPMDIEYRVVDPSGGEKWVRSTSHPKRRADGAVEWEGAAVDVTAFRQATLRLRDDELLLASIAANLRGGGIFRRILHPDGRVTYPRSSAHFDDAYDCDTIPAKEDAAVFLDAVHPDDREAWQEALRRSAETLERFDVTYRIGLEDGSFRWLRSIASTRRNADGCVVWDGVVINMDEEKRLERELRAREVRFRDFAEAASDSFWEMDSDLRFVWSNYAFPTSLVDEVGVEHLRGKTRWELAGGDPETDELWRRHKADLEAHRPFRDFRYSLVAPSGRRIHLRASGMPIFDASGRFVGYRGTASDETAFVEARIEAERLQVRLGDAIEAIPAGFVLFDSEDRFVLCNTRYREMYPRAAPIYAPGAAFETMIRKSLAEGEVELPEGMTVEEWVAMRIAQHREPSGPILQRMADGRRIQIAGRRMADGGIVEVRLDVSELTRAQDELRAAKDAAEAANRAKSVMLANVSHELRTPLNAIIGFSEVMLGELFGPLGAARYREYARDMRESGLHLLGIVTDLIDMAKIEAGWIEMEDGVVDLADLAARVTRLLAGQAAARGVRLSLALPAGAPYLRADERAVRQMLINLVGNALKFTPKGGTVALEAGVDEAGQYRVSIVDTGMGIPSDQIGRVVEPFAQVGAALTRSHEGAGLGLAITVGLIERHGGRFMIESAGEGRGTRATLVFAADRVLG